MVKRLFLILFFILISINPIFAVEYKWNPFTNKQDITNNKAEEIDLTNFSNFFNTASPPTVQSAIEQIASPPTSLTTSYWKTSTDQSSLSGTKSGTYNLSTSGTLSAGATTVDSLVIDTGGITLLAGQDIRPSANSTTAINIAQADGTDFVTFNTTNKRVGIGTTTPSSKLTVQGSINVGGIGSGDTIFTASDGNPGDTIFTISRQAGNIIQFAPYSNGGFNFTNNLSIAGTLGAGATTLTGALAMGGNAITNAGAITGTSLIKSGGTSSQFLKADGSVDSSTYLTSYTETDPVVKALTGIIKSSGSAIGTVSVSSPLDYTTGTLSHLATAGNIHLPTNGLSNQILKNSGTSGTGAWGTVTENAGALNSITTLTASGNINTSAGKIQEGSYNLIPAGSMMMWTTTTAPSGWLLCDGTAVSRTTYATLFAIIGTTFGIGDNSTTFNLPNVKGKFPVGLNSTDTAFDVMGETGGSATQTFTLAAGIAVGTYTGAYSATTTSKSILNPYITLNYIIKY